MILTEISIYLSIYLSIQKSRSTISHRIIHERTRKQNTSSSPLGARRREPARQIMQPPQKQPYMYHMSRLDYGNCLHIVRCLYTQAYESQRFPGTLDPQAFATGSTNKEVNYIARNTPYGQNREDPSHGC